MMPLSGLGKLLIGLGCLLVIIGVGFLWVGKIPWFGRLPGDIYVERPNFTFFFPVTTSILISALLSLMWYLRSRR
jgi:hypothetical protein